MSLRSNEITTREGRTMCSKNKVQLSAECLDKFSGLMQAALTLLYGCGVSLDGDKEFGSVAATLEGFKDAASARAEKMRTQSAPKKMLKDMDDADMEDLMTWTWGRDKVGDGDYLDALASEGFDVSAKTLPAFLQAVAKEWAARCDAKDARPATCPRCQRLPVKENGLCASCLSVVTPTTETATPAVAKVKKPAKAKGATVAAETAKIETPKVESVVPEAVTPKVATQNNKPSALPTTYKALCSLGGEGVRALAKQLGVKADGLGFGVLCGKVWAKVKDATATKQNDKPQTADAPQAKGETFKAGTVVVADGKGGFTVATEAQLWAALEALSGKAAA
jgi:hypothetical protein